MDVPEVLILVCLAAMIWWALYNWTHPNLGSRK
jgi:hypothetical protein